MSKGPNKPFSINPSRQISHTRLYDESNLETRYELLNKLGEGSFGTVYRVRNKENDVFYALKTIQKKPGNKLKASILDNEVKLLTEVNHSNLIQLHEVLESSQNLYLVVELCEGGELGGFIKKNGPLPEETVKQIMSKLINALHYLHKMDIVHRDLKLENILLKNTPSSKTDLFDIRVTDFGLSSKQSITCTDSLFNDYCGTPLYMAPEILENKNYSALCDVWAMGIIMYYLISGRHPYVANDERRLLETIRSQKLRFDSEKFRNLSPEGLDFLQGMLVYDTVHRRTMGELTVHPWLTGRSDKGPAKDIITMMKEFKAENDRNQAMIENNLSALINATANPGHLSTNLNEPSLMSFESNSSKLQESFYTDSKQSKISANTNESRTTFDKNKLNIKTVNRLTTDNSKTPRRVSNDVSGNLSNFHARVKQNDALSDIGEIGPSRRPLNSPTIASSTRTLTKLRPGQVRLGRSQSQADFRLSSKITSPSQHQRRTLINSIDMNLSTASSISMPNSNDFATSIPPKPPTATTTALMMINKQYPNNSSTYLPAVSNHQHQNTNKIPMYDKRNSSYT